MKKLTTMLEKYSKIKESKSSKEPKDVWKTGGQQVMTIDDMSVLYNVDMKSNMINVKYTKDGKKFNPKLKLTMKNADPEKDILKHFQMM